MQWPALPLGATTPCLALCDHLGERGPRRLNPLLELGRVEAADGMLHHKKFGLDPACLRLRDDERAEGFRGDDVGGDTALLELDAVVETPR